MGSILRARARAAGIIRDRSDDDRPSASARGYDSTWRKVRDAVLARRPLCVRCERAGRVTPATCVDHIIPIAAGGARLDDANLQPLCDACHARKTAREDGGFGRRSVHPRATGDETPGDARRDPDV